MKLSYRSANIPSGFFNTMGSAHIHIDGSQDSELILKIVKELDARGNVGKLNIVYDFIAGQQREILPETYQSHTPSLAGAEALDFFSTNLIKDRTDALNVINYISKMLQGTSGIIVELEQVIGCIDENGIYSGIDVNSSMLPIAASEVSLSPSPSEKFEIHYGFEIAKGWRYNISLKDIMAFCEYENIIVGGWFIFEKENTLAYRSNSFSNGNGIINQISHEHSILSVFLEKRGVGQPKTMIEKVIGIWHV